MSAAPFFPKNYVCPVCKTPFSSLAVRTSAAVSSTREPDFHQLYHGISPLHYAIVVCPSCNYAAGAASMKDEQIPSKNVEALSRALLALHREPNNLTGERSAEDALKAWMLAVQTAQLKKQTPGQKAGLLLGVAWLCRETGDSQKELQYLDESLNAYVEAFHNEKLPLGGLDELSVIYLIGELYRRTGRPNEALSWFSKVVNHPLIKTKPAIDKLAREQWQQTREDYKNAVAGETVTPSAPSAPVMAAPEVEAAAQPAAKPAKGKLNRGRMQMNANLYTDQIEWLNRMVNKNYEQSHVLITREEVLRALVDAAIEHFESLGLPEHFASEDELRKALIRAVNPKS